MSCLTGLKVTEQRKYFKTVRRIKQQSWSKDRFDRAKTAILRQMGGGVASSRVKELCS